MKNNKKVYCKNCKWSAKQTKKFNENGLRKDKFGKVIFDFMNIPLKCCEHYKRKWWKIWAK